VKALIYTTVPAKIETFSEIDKNGESDGHILDFDSPTSSTHSQKPKLISTKVAAANAPIGTTKPAHDESPPAISTAHRAGSRGPRPPAAVTSKPVKMPSATENTEQEVMVVHHGHVGGDVAEPVIRRFKGTRPDLLRMSSYYAGAKVRTSMGCDSVYVVKAVVCFSFC